MSFREEFHHPHEAAWHHSRTEGVGGSDVASIMGRGFTSRFDLHYQKVNREPGEDPSERMRMGILLEPVIRGLFATKHPEFAVRPAGTCIHEPEEWRRCNPDGWVWEGRAIGRPVAGLEIKNVDARQRHDWNDPLFQNIPQHYYDQVQWCMDVTSHQVWFVAALFGGNSYAEYEVTYDEPYAKELRAEAHTFWRGVLDQLPPDVDFRDATRDRLRQLHPDVEAEDVTIDPELAAEFRRRYASHKEAEKAYKQTANRVLAAVGDGRRAIGPDQTVIASRSVFDRETIDTAALRLDQPGIAAQYTKTSTTHQLRPAPAPKETPDDHTK